MEAFKIHAQKEELYDANIALMDQHTREPLPGESVCGGTEREKIVSEIPDGNAVVYCEGAFDTTDGKTAHCLVRFTNRYRVISIIDSHCTGQDAGQILDGTDKGIPAVATLDDAINSGAGASGLVEILKRYIN